MAESKNITTQEIVEELKNRGKSSDEILEFLYSNEKHAVNAETKGKENEITKDENDIKKQVTNILRELGMPAHIKGYRYARYAIILVVKNPEYLSAITKKLYPDVAKEFNTTSSRVERAIRHAIEVAWERGADESWKKYFGNTVANMKKNPTNSEFVATISDVIKIKR